jgi:hypothetical protein
MFMPMISDVPASAEQILEAYEKALSRAPAEYPPTFPLSKELSGAPEWYAFEHRVWPIGESYDALLSRTPSSRIVDL